MTLPSVRSVKLPTMALPESLTRVILLPGVGTAVSARFSVNPVAVNPLVVSTAREAGTSGAQAAGARSERDGTAVAVQGGRRCWHPARSARRRSRTGRRFVAAPAVVATVAPENVMSPVWVRIADGDGAGGRGEDPGELGAGEVDAVDRVVVVPPRLMGRPGSDD